MQIDECSFSPYDKVHRRNWAPAGRPLLLSREFDSQQKYVSVIGAVSEDHGKVNFKFKFGSFLGKDVANFLQQIVNRRKNKKVVFFMDPASIHRAQVVTRKLDLPSFRKARRMFSIVSRPDTNGIENVWTPMKKQYKEVINNHKARRTTFNNFGIVSTLVANIDSEYCKQCSRRGWEKLLAAQPLDHEEPVESDESS